MTSPRVTAIFVLLCATVFLVSLLVFEKSRQIAVLAERRACWSEAQAGLARNWDWPS